MSESLFVILGNQLFSPSLWPAEARGVPVFMAEDHGLCTHYKYHKHKIILFLAAMRSYATELSERGVRVDYRQLSSKTAGLSYEDKLASAVKTHRVKQLIVYEIEDKFFESRIADFCKQHKLTLKTLPSPMFLTTRAQFSAYLESSRKPFMKSFYEEQRRRLDLLMTPAGTPVGGQYSYDPENRKPLPKSLQPPAIARPRPSAIVQAVAKLTDELFADHPGTSAEFWLSVTRKQALARLDEFCRERLELFGPYEDAIPQRSTFLFHSVLSPLINLGLLTPAEVIQKAIAVAGKQNVPLPSLEGFVRQVVGWREFIRGIYQNFSAKEERGNFFKHHKKLSSMWYSANTGIPPLDATLAKVLKLGWCNHIERLMVLSNLMLLCEVHPSEAHRWFMEMFVDSSDWVMGPNVYGMGQFSDGGLFATKPYICGSNYMIKMSDHTKGDWCDVVDGLYWSFIDRHRVYFAKNPRTMYLPTNLDRLTAERRARLFERAENFRKLATR